MLQPITDRVYAVPGLSMGRVYVIEMTSGLAVVDASLAADTANRLASHLHGKSWTLADIRTVLITHAHPDHVGGLPGILERTNAQVIIHHRDAQAARSGAAPYPRPETLPLHIRLTTLIKLPQPPVRVDREVQAGAILDEVLPGLQVVETPGHTLGHVSYYWPAARLLFGGDVVLNMPWGLTPPISGFTVDMAQAKRSIKTVADLDVEILCPGHGQPILSGAGARLRALAARL